MDFNHTEARRMLSDSLRRYLSDQYDLETRNQIAYAAPYYSPDHWQALCDLGVLGMLVGEDLGGFGGEGFDIAVVFEELGRALCPEPMLANLLCLKALGACGEKDHVAAIVAGEQRMALALHEPEQTDVPTQPSTKAEPSGDGFKLTGVKSVVYGAPAATHLLVLATSPEGVDLFLCEAPSAAAFAMIDGGGAAQVKLDGIEGRRVASGAEGIVSDALDAGRLALCAEAVGAMDVLLEMTIDYLKQRSQFGTPIATFQALQHRVVDMAIELEQARSMTILAAGKLGTDEQTKTIAMAKNLIGRAATLVAEEATQMHGGIGMTWEYAGSHYTKRLVMIDHQLGDRYWHLNRLLAAA